MVIRHMRTSPALLARVRRFEHPSTVLETATLPIELLPYISQKIRQPLALNHWLAYHACTLVKQIFNPLRMSPNGDLYASCILPMAQQTRTGAYLTNPDNSYSASCSKFAACSVISFLVTLYPYCRSVFLKCQYHIRKYFLIFFLYPA